MFMIANSEDLESGEKGWKEAPHERSLYRNPGARWRSFCVGLW